MSTVSFVFVYYLFWTFYYPIFVKNLFTFLSRATCVSYVTVTRRLFGHKCYYCRTLFDKIKFHFEDCICQVGRAIYLTALVHPLVESTHGYHINYGSIAPTVNGKSRQSTFRFFQKVCDNGRHFRSFEGNNRLLTEHPSSNLIENYYIVITNTVIISLSTNGN